jgi:hypothetical protein
LLKRKEIKIKLEPKKYIPFVSCKQEKQSNYYIFIGKKLKLEGQKQPYYCNTITVDGNFPKNTIIFTALDHYGIPKFNNFENFLLFVGEYCGKLYHEKHQYFDLYKTKNGKRAKLLH